MSATWFRDELEFLSNFSRHQVVLDGFYYPTAEHAFQAAKTLDPNLRHEFRHDISPATAKHRGRLLRLRPDWEHVKVQVMRLVLASKFTVNDNLAGRLIFQTPTVLIETNGWHDNEWGDCACGRPQCVLPGNNLLGRCLMDLRTYLAGSPR